MTIPPSAPSTLVTSEYISFSSPNCSLRSPISSATFPLVVSSALLFIISIFFKLSLISITSSFTTLRLSANPSCFLSISFCLSIIRLISIFSDTKILSHLVHKNFTPIHNVVPEAAFFNSPYNEFETFPHFICTHFLQISQSIALSADFTSSLHSAHFSKVNPSFPSPDVDIIPTTPPSLVCKTLRETESVRPWQNLSSTQPPVYPPLLPLLLQYLSPRRAVTPLHVASLIVQNVCLVSTCRLPSTIRCF